MQTLEETAEATLELTLLSIDGHVSRSFLAKQKPSITVWVDPAHKRSTTSRSTVLHLPLSPRHLRNPSSVLTVQIISPRLAFKPFRSSSTTASVYLSSLQLSRQPVTLHLRRPSGRVTASVSFSVRILWSLVPDPVLNDSSTGFGAESGLTLRLEPSAPPFPEPDEKMPEESSAWRNFLLGAFSGAAAVILVNAIRQQ